MKAPTLICACVAAAAIALVVPAAADVIDPVASSNEGLPFPEDAENEPALTIDRNPARTGPLLVAGANDYHDQTVCASSPCQFQPRVGFSGVYYSPTGATWSQGSYPNTAGTGPANIRTLPNFTYEWSVGDAALAAGPRPSGPPTKPTFAWSNGTRLYYSTLTKLGQLHGVDLSWADPSSPTAQPSWSHPSIVQVPAHADRPSVWADNAESSANRGHVYVCWSTLKGTERFPQRPEGAIAFRRSADGGGTWDPVRQLHSNGSGRHGCAIRTDSSGKVYVFWEEIKLTPVGIRAVRGPTQSMPCGKLVKASIMMAVSVDGVQPFGNPQAIASVVEPGFVDVRKGPKHEAACTIDGRAGARTNGWPSVDIANGAPNQKGPDTMVVAWADGRTTPPSVLVRVGHQQGANWSWSAPQNAADRAGTSATDRPTFPAVALSPNGAFMYVVYSAFLAPSPPSNARPLQAVVRVTKLADFETKGSAALWGEVRGQQGDARGSSSPDLTAEFLGDYNAVVATNERGYAAWTDATFALDCPAIDTFRAKNAQQSALPTKCPAGPKNRDGAAKRFGNVSICTVGIDASEIGKPITSVDACAP